MPLREGNAVSRRAAYNLVSVRSLALQRECENRNKAVLCTELNASADIPNQCFPKQSMLRRKLIGMVE